MAPSRMGCSKSEPETRDQGRTHGGGGDPPWDLKNTIFSGFLPLNYVICIFKICFFSFLLCGRTEEACSMLNSLRKVDFSQPTGCTPARDGTFSSELEAPGNLLGIRDWSRSRDREAQSGYFLEAESIHIFIVPVRP